MTEIYTVACRGNASTYLFLTLERLLCALLNTSRLGCVMRSCKVSNMSNIHTCLLAVREALLHGLLHPNLYIKCKTYLTAAQPYYFRTFLACLTRFSMTPSNASRSPIVSSVFLVQYSSASFAAPCNSSKRFT